MFYRISVDVLYTLIIMSLFIRRSVAVLQKLVAPDVNEIIPIQEEKCFVPSEVQANDIHRQRYGAILEQRYQKQRYDSIPEQSFGEQRYQGQRYGGAQEQLNGGIQDQRNGVSVCLSVCLCDVCTSMCLYMNNL